MLVMRASKAAAIAAIAFFASLVAFGNITDYQTNFNFVFHVFEMDTISPSATTEYRAIMNPLLQNGAYMLIIAAETLTAILCWVGAAQLFGALRSSAAEFNRSKGFAVSGLTLGFLVWQVGFMSVGGEWFGMWMSKQWDGVPDAFRFFVTILAVLIYVSLKDDELA